MKERPILFSGPMVRAILEGRKTQTRRVINPQPPNAKRVFWWALTERERAEYVSGAWHVAPDGCWINDSEGLKHFASCPYGVPGDRLWVRETWRGGDDTLDSVFYRADEQCPVCPHNICMCRWRPSIFMPRKFSRITLEIVKVRVERVQDISVDDIAAEGAVFAISDQNGEAYKTAMAAAAKRSREIGKGYPWGIWAERWDAINAKRGFGWDANPWVWVLEFRRIEAA